MTIITDGLTYLNVKKQYAKNYNMNDTKTNELGKSLEIEKILKRNIINHSIYYKNFSFDYNVKINGVFYKMQSSSPSIIRYPSSSSSSVINNEIKYVLNIRLINYYINDNGISVNHNGINVLTLNKILYLDKHFNVCDKYWIPIKPRNNIQYNGIEDVRLFNYNNQIYYIGSYYDNNKIGIVSAPINILSSPIYKLNWIEPNFNTSNNWEKNWVFFEYNNLKISANKLCIIYKWKPLYICQINYEPYSNKLNLIKVNNKVPKLFYKFRGSTNGVTYDNKIWFITHFHHIIGGIRKYLHCFIVFDLDMNLIGYSSPFNFRNRLIEFCIGMIENNHNFIITYSVLDKTSELMVVPISNIQSIIHSY